MFGSVNMECLVLWIWSVLIREYGVSGSVNMEYLVLWIWSVWFCEYGVSGSVNMECLVLWIWSVCFCEYGVFASVNMECLVYFSISQGYQTKTNTKIILMETLKTFKLKKKKKLAQRYQGYYTTCKIWRKVTNISNII